MFTSEMVKALADRKAVIICHRADANEVRDAFVAAGIDVIVQEAPAIERGRMYAVKSLDVIPLKISA